MNQVKLNTYNNSAFNRGGSKLKELLWMFCSALFFQHSLAGLNGLKIGLLKKFGAQVGQRVLIKPNVRIKFPWKLVLGNDVWIGESVWIDNLDRVSIADNVCLSQGAMLLCGNHNYKSSSFDLMVSPIVLEEGVWIGAKAVVCPGVHCHSHAVLSVGSVAVADLEAYMIYQGNPAEAVKTRVIN
ncbi:WcaF family extracellular polysaccharide biosynthesis acetyltransferase [Haliscomenobacter sp.]|uniref:WcaF family extracellular polysaccharide biosynthesis acetyltransferase n=1 Tax=Haliscomenobacter sp. TaxID=2717303 RepID=UPI003594917C